MAIAESNPDTGLALSPRVRFRAVGNEGVLVHIESGRVIVLNDTGLHVVRLLDQGARTRSELADSLSAQFEVEAADAAADVAAFLAVLDAEQVLVPAPGVE